MVETLDDLLTHRVGITLVAPDAVREHALEWARLAAPILGWDDARASSEAAATRERALHFSPP